MASQLLLAAPPRKRPSILSSATTAASAVNRTTTTTTTTTTITVSAAADGTTTTSGGTTTSSPREDDLREIFLRLPDLPSLVCAALTSRSWLGVVRSSPAFRRLFRDLHPAPLIGLFIGLNGNASPFFVPLPLPDSCSHVTAILRRGDFLLTSLPQSFTGWSVTDSRYGYILLWNKLHYNDMCLALLNPMTWAVDILPSPDGIAAGSRRDFGLIGFHLQSSDENPLLFQVICVCADQQKVRAAIFSSESWDWVIQPWVNIGGDNSLKFKAGSLVDGSIYWPYHGEGRMLRINTNTLDITTVDLPGQVQVDGFNFRAGETKVGQLCIIYQSGLSLHIWIRSSDSDGTEIWVPQNVVSLSSEIDRITQERHGSINIVQVRAGYVYLSMTHMTLTRRLYSSFFSLSLETLKLELLLEGQFDGGSVYPYIMAWPPSLVADDGSIGYDAEGSH